MGKYSKKKRKQNKKAKKQLVSTNTLATNGWVSKSDCHTGHNLIFKTQDGIEVWGGGKNRAGGWHKMSPPPQLAMGPSETLSSWGMKDKTEVPEGWSCEQHLDNVEPPHMLSLDWPDFNIPNVSKYFWYAVIDDIREHDIKTISTQCAGGHGRTGVQLAILAYLLGTEDERAAWPDAGVLIEWVREQHCFHAVETVSQQQYISDVCDIPYGEDKMHTKPAASYSWGGSYGGGGSGKVSPTTVTTGDDYFYDDLQYEQGQLIIDKMGADYCPSCKHIPPQMMHDGDECPKCGETFLFDDERKYSYEEDDTSIPCTACGSEDIHDESNTCLTCHYDMSKEDKPYKIDKACSTCGDLYDTSNMDGSICMACVFQIKHLDKKDLRVKMDSKMNPRFDVKCSQCNKWLPCRHIKNILTLDKNITYSVCYACSAKDKPKKEMKQ